MMECRDTVTLMEVFRKVWEGCPQGKPTFVGLSLHDLVPESLHTASFFMEEEKRGRIANVMDSLNGKYGEQTLYVGGRQTSSEAMPPRIAFSYIPEL
jgi:DNA polymerase-4